MTRIVLLIFFVVVCAGCDAFSLPEIPSAFRAREDGDRPTTARESLGDVVVAQAIDRDGCAVESVTSFDDSDEIYIVLEDSAFPEGTTFFARLYDGRQALEDTEELVADQDYSNVCVNFVFEPSLTAEVWETGEYEVELFVNGNSYQAVTFEIR